jgi:RNA polymerase sigma-70 factor (ECF subfamily)
VNDDGAAGGPATLLVPQPPHRTDGEDDDGWLSALRSAGQERELASRRLHGLLLRAARFEVARRRPTLPAMGRRELDDLAVQAADDAVVAVLARLDSFRGASRFTTWAYKFAIYQTAEILAAVRQGIARLTPHQRSVLVALTLDEVPIDVLAERLGTTRGALYKTLHDARRNLRGRLAERGLLPTATTKEIR